MRPLVSLSICTVAVSGMLLSPLPLRAKGRSLLENLPLIGASGGNSFSRTCPSGSVLTGIRWRTGMFVDGIGIQCSTILAGGTLGPANNVGDMAGGNGGTAGSDHCPGGVIAGQNGATAGASLGSLFFRCYQWFPESRSYGGAIMKTINVRIGLLISASESQCHSGTQPATGIYGRHGSLIDAVGLKCNTP